MKQEELHVARVDHGDGRPNSRQVIHLLVCALCGGAFQTLLNLFLCAFVVPSCDKTGANFLYLFTPIFGTFFFGGWGPPPDLPEKLGENRLGESALPYSLTFE